MKYRWHLGDPSHPLACQCSLWVPPNGRGYLHISTEITNSTTQPLIKRSGHFTDWYKAQWFGSGQITVAKDRDESQIGTNIWCRFNYHFRIPGEILSEILVQTIFNCLVRFLGSLNNQKLFASKGPVRFVGRMNILWTALQWRFEIWYF